MKTFIAAPAQGQKRPNPLSAGGWAIISYIISYAVGALLYLPLARKLVPTDFGLYTIATVVSSGIVLVISFTLERALIRTPGDRDDVAQATLWLSVIIGLLGTVVCALIGLPMSAIYSNERLVFIMVLLSPGVLAAALGAVPHAMLSRELNFRLKLWPESISVTLAAVVSLGAALLGAGVYSLVLYALLRLVLNSVIGWIVVSWRPTGQRPSLATLKRLLSFGVPALGGEITLYARFNVDYAIGGRILGADSLGVYALAWNTSDRLALLLNSAFGSSVGFPTFSRLQNDPERLRRVYLSATGLIAAAALPIFLSGLFLREELVRVIFGPIWQNMIAPLFPLLILQLFWVVFYPSASLVLALGHSRLYAVVNTASLILTVGAVIVGSQIGGVVGLAWSMLTIVGLTSFIWAGLACNIVRPAISEIWRVARVPLLLTFTTTPAVALVQMLCASVGLPMWLRLLVSILVGLAVLTLVARLSWSLLRQDFDQLRERLPD